MSPINWSKPRFEEFHLSGPPPGFKQKIWRICQAGDESAPIPLDLEGIGRVWILGWFSFKRGRFQESKNLKFSFSGAKRTTSEEQDAEDLIPDNGFEIWGAISVVSRQVAATRHTISAVKDRVRQELRRIFDQWLETEVRGHPEEFRRVIQVMLPSSDRLRELILKPGLYRRLAHEYLEVETSSGKMTPSQLASAPGEAVSQYRAVYVMHADHLRDWAELEGHVVLCVKYANERIVVNSLLKAAKISIKPVDHISFDPLLIEIGQEADEEPQDPLLLILRKGLEDSPARAVHFKLSTDGRLAAIPAIAVPSAPLPGDWAGDPAETLLKPLVHITVLVNPLSELAHSVRQLDIDSQLVKLATPSIYSLAVQYSLSPDSVRLLLHEWEQITRWIDVSREHELEVAKLNVQLSEARDAGDPRKIAELQHRLQVAEEQLQFYRQMMGSFSELCVAEQEVITT